MAGKRRHVRYRHAKVRDVVETDIERAIGIEGNIGRIPMSFSALLMARRVVQRGYAGPARRPKVCIPYASEENKRRE